MSASFSFLSLLFILVSVYKLAKPVFDQCKSYFNFHNSFKLLTRSYITCKVTSVQERLTLISILQFY